MTEFQFGTSKMPPEIKLLNSSEVNISETDLNTLIQAALLHLDGHEEEAGRLYSSTASHTPTVFSGLLSLLRAGRSLPLARRRMDVLMESLRQCRVPVSWQPALVAAMCAPPPPSTAAAPIHWNLDVIISDSERGRVLEPSVSLKIPSAGGGDTCLQLPKAQFLRLRREMAVARREVENIQAKCPSRPG